MDNNQYPLLNATPEERQRILDIVMEVLENCNEKENGFND